MNLLENKLRQPNTTPAGTYQVVHTVPIATTAMQKPDRPTSTLVEDSFLMLPKNMAVDVKENLVNIKNAIKGQSNDHDLGRINDFAMKSGSLALATYLFTKARTPMSKTMEFVGALSFFGAMALWPKVAIAEPVKAMYGVDVQQKYKDNNGHTKKFFQDPQYIPWDLYTDEELAALGDKLGIDKDIPNRNEVVKKKAQKIALQSNTLWMLTAGVATPVGCALMCNAAEKLIAPMLEKGKIKQAEKSLKNIDKIVASKMTAYEPKKLTEFLKVFSGSQVTPEMITHMAKQMRHDGDVLAPEMLEAQIKEILSPDAQTVTKDYAEKFLAEYKRSMKSSQSSLQKTVKSDILKEFGTKRDKILELVDGKMSKKVFHLKVKDILKEVILSRNLDQDDVPALLEDYSSFVNAHKKSAASKIMKLTPEAATKIQVLDRVYYEFSTRKAVIDKYASTILGNKAETVAATRWNKVAETFFKALNISSKELEQAKTKGPLSSELLIKKMEALASNEAAYKSAVSKIQKAILEFDKVVAPDAQGGIAQGVRKTLTEQYSALCEKTAEKCREANLDVVVKRLVGDPVSAQGSLKSNLLDAAYRRPLELRSGLYNILHSLDFFRRADDYRIGWSDSKFAERYRKLSQEHGGVALNPANDTFKKDLDLCKKYITSGTIAQNTTKLGYGNPQFGVYDRMMKLVHSTELAPATEEALENVTIGNTSFLTSFKTKIHNTLAHIGNAKYPHAEKVVTQGVNGGGGDILVRDSLVGAKLSDVFQSAASNIYNSGKWLKMFGGTFAVLVGGTLLAETMFGRLSPEYSKKEKDNK